MHVVVHSYTLPKRLTVNRALGTVIIHYAFVAFSVLPFSYLLSKFGVISETSALVELNN